MGHLMKLWMRYLAMLEIVLSNQFRKDLKVAKKRGCKIEHLRDVVNTLARGQELDKKYRDHGLTGNYKGFRECILIYSNGFLVHSCLRKRS